MTIKRIGFASAAFAAISLSSQAAAQTAVPVTVDNFARAESDFSEAGA